ncbi:hypothetical protein GQ600_17138 [Phytophthora cactorum]|nr:hypothetical protein GQ600_17138 [Phytophthora cactorum]
MSRSANLALDCVNAAMATNKRPRQDWEAFGRRLESQNECFASRKSVIEGFINDVLPPRDVFDPLERLEISTTLITSKSDCENLLIILPNHKIQLVFILRVWLFDMSLSTGLSSGLLR